MPLHLSDLRGLSCFFLIWSQVLDWIYVLFILISLFSKMSNVSSKIKTQKYPKIKKYFKYLSKLLVKTDIFCSDFKLNIETVIIFFTELVKDYQFCYQIL